MIEYLVLDMFKFNFNINENNSNDNMNIKDEENCLINQEFGYFNIEDLQNISKEDEEINREKFQLHKSDLVPNIYEGKLIRL